MVSIARQRVSRRRLHALVMAAGTAVAFYSAAASPSLPQNPNAVEGSITTTLTPGLGGTPNQTLTVNTFKNNTIINWQSFNIANGNTVQFNQPGVNSRVLNRINSTTPSQIHGNLFSNGQVFLVNPAGVIFGPSAVINTGGLVAAAGTITNQNFLDGNYQFNNLVGGVENHGRIHAPVVALVGRYVTQAGLITGSGAGGTGSSGGGQFGPADVVILAAGENVLIGPMFGSVFVSAPADLGPGVGDDAGSPMGAGDVFSIAAWHAPRGNTSANAVRIASRGTATLDGTINAGQTLDVRSLNDLSVNGTVIAGNALLRSELGGISGPGVITSPTLALEAHGNISLDGSNGNGHQVGSVEASSVAGSILFVNDGDLIVKGASTAPGQDAEFGSRSGSLTMAGPVNVGALELRALEGAIIGDGLLTASQLDVLAGLGVDLRGVVGTLGGAAGVAGGAALGGGHSFVFDNESGTLNINGVSATLDVLITSGGGIAVVDGSIDAGRNIRLTAGGNIAATGGGMFAGDEIDLDAAGGINATQVLSADHAKMLAANGISATNMSVDSVQANSTNGGNINLFNNRGLLVQGVTTTGNITISSAGTMTIQLQVAGDVVTLNALGIPSGGEGPSILIESRVEALSTLSMNALGDIRTQNGGIVQAGTDSQAGTINADAGGDVSLDIVLPGGGSELSGTAGGDMDLTVFGDSQLTLSGISVGGGFTISAGEMNDAGGFNIVINNLASGASIDIGTNGTITVNGNLQAGVDELISLTGQKGIILEPGSLLDFAGGGIDRRVLLRSAAAIAQTGGGGISAGQLQALGNLVSLLGSNNQVSVFAANAPSGVALNNNGALEIGTTSFGGETTSGITANHPVLVGDITINNDGTITISQAVFSSLGSVEINANSGNIIIDNQVFALNAGVDINASNGSVIVNDIVSANLDANISGHGGINAAAGTFILGANVLLVSSNGAITLAGTVDGNNSVIVDANGNVLIDIGALVKGETVGILSTNGDIDIQGNTESNNLTYINAQNGAITTTGNGLITAQQLQVLAQFAIDIRAAGTGGVPLTVAGRSEASNIDIDALTRIVVGQVGSPIETTTGLEAVMGDVNLRSLTLGNAGISVLQPIRASDTVRLDTRGTLTSGGFGRIIAPTLIIGGGVANDDERPTLVDLLNITAGGDTNEVATLDVQARGEVLFRNDGALLIQRIATNDFVLVLNDGSVQIVEIDTDASGDVAIIAENGNIELLGGPGNAGIVAAGQTVVLDARSNGARVLDAGTGEAFGTITAAQLKVLADSGILLDASHSVGTLAAQTRTGDIRFFNLGNLQIGQVGPVAGVPGDATLAGVTTLEAFTNDIIRIESGNGTLFIDQDVATFASPGMLPPDNRVVELRANNGAILGMGRIIGPRLEAYSRNGIELQGDNLVGTLVAQTTGGFGPFPPLAPNGIVFYNISDLIVESALAPNNIQISAEGNLRFQRAVAGGTLAGHAGGDLIIENRGAFAETLRSGSWMSLYALNDVLIQRGGRIDAGSWLTLNAQRDIRQSVGAGFMGSQAIAGGNIRYDAGRAIQLNSFSTVNSTNGMLARFLAGGELGGLGISFGAFTSVAMDNPNAGVFLNAATSGIGQSVLSQIIAGAIEARAANGVSLIGANQTSLLAGVAGNGDFVFNNINTPLLTIGTLNLDGFGPDSVGVVANGNALINTLGGSMLVSDHVLANSGNASLTAIGNIIVDSEVIATENALVTAGQNIGVNAGALVQSGLLSTLNAGGSIGVDGMVDAGTAASLLALQNVGVAGTVRSGDLSLLSAGDSIDVSGLVDAGTDAFLTALLNIGVSGDVLAVDNANLLTLGLIDITDTGRVRAEQGSAALTAVLGDVVNAGLVEANIDASLSAGNDILVSGQVLAGNDADLDAGNSIALSFGGLVDAGNNASFLAGNDIDISGDAIAGVNASLNAGSDIGVSGRVLAGNNASLTAQNDIDVLAGGLVQTGNNATLFAQQNVGVAGTVFTGGDALLDAGNNLDVFAGGLVDSNGFSTLNAGNAIDIAGIVSATAGSGMLAGSGIDISGGVFGGSTAGTALTGPINISGIIDVNGNAIMNALSGPIAVTNSGQITATGDAALTAALGIDMAGTINAALAELNAGEAISASGSITANQLLALAQLDINLTGGNIVANFAGNSAAGSIFFNNNGGLVITSVSRVGGGTADGARALNGTVTIVNANGTVTVQQVTGATIQAILADIRVTGGQLVGGGIINTPQLRALANQGISLTGNNIVGTLAAGSNGAILFNNAGNLIIGQVTGTNGIATVGVQSPGTVSLFSQNGSIDVQTVLNANRLNLVARNGGLGGIGNITANEAFLLAFNDINLLNADVNLGSLAASSLGGSVRIGNNSGITLQQLTLTEPLRQIAGITAEQAVINGLFANHQIEVRANGNINVNVDRLVALNANNAQGNQDAIILDTGYSAANPSRSIVINGLPGSNGMVEFITQGNGGNVRLLGNVTSPTGRSLSVWAGANGTVEFAGNIGTANQRLGSLIVGNMNNDLQSFRDNGNTIFRGDVFVSERLLVQGNTTMGPRLFGPQSHTIDIAGGTMELFGNVLAGGQGQSLNFLFDLNQQYEVLSQINDEFAVRVPLRFYGSIGTEANPFQSVRLGGDLSATLASTIAFIDRDLRLNELGQFNVNALSNIHTDQAFNIWTNDGLTMGDGQRMLVLGDLNIRSNNLGAQNFLSDITVVGTAAQPGFVGGNLRIDGDVFMLTRPQPLAILDRFTVLPSNEGDTRVRQAFDLGADLIATNSIQVFGNVRRIAGRSGNAFLSTQSGGNISVGGSDFAFRTFGGSVSMADALIAAGFPGTPEFRFGPVVPFDLVATGPTNDNLGEALADALPDLEAADVIVSVDLDARDIEVLQRELGLAVDTTPTPSNLPITTGQPRANAPTVAAVADDAVASPAPPVIRERVSPEGVRQVVVAIFDAFGTAETIDTVRFPQFGDRRARFAAFGDAFQVVYDEDPNLAAFRSQVFAQADTDQDAATVASMLRGVDALMREVRDLGLTDSELETIYSVLADRFLNQAGLSEQFAGDTAFNATLVRELLGFPPARGTAGAAPDATASGDGDRPAVSLRTNRR